MKSGKYIDNFSFNLKLNILTPYILLFISTVSILMIFIILSLIEELDNTPVNNLLINKTTTNNKIPQNTSKKSYSGNRSLDSLYNDASGNETESNGRLVSTVNMSTDKHACSFRITYKGNNDRSVKCISGCDGSDSENSKFCSQYVYNDSSFQQGSLSDTLLDREYNAIS